MDASSEDLFKNPFWNKNESWIYKWKEYDPCRGWVEKFPGSSTVFVWTTDGWHFLQFMFNNCWQLALALYSPYNMALSFVVIKTVYSGIFTVNYKILKRKFG